MKLWHWILIASALRLISAITHASWNHPDEWYQTVEFANYLVRGIMSHTQEVDLHLRNMSWPVLLSLPLGLSYCIAPDSVGFRILSVKFFVGLCSLSVIWAWWQLCKENPRKNWIMAGQVFLNFTIADSVRPSAENSSSYEAWLSVGFAFQKKWTRVGFFKWLARRFDIRLRS